MGDGVAYNEKLVRGGVPEWLKGTDCKSVGYAYVGSNPTPSTSTTNGALNEMKRGLNPRV